MGVLMANFFDTVDSKNWRQIAPNLYIWWGYDASHRLWFATQHDSEGNQVAEGSWETDKFDAIIQCMKYGREF